MSGPVILINAVRGLQMSDGGLQKINFALQVLVLLAVTLSISLAFTASASGAGALYRDQGAKDRQRLGRARAAPGYRRRGGGDARHPQPGRAKLGRSLRGAHGGRRPPALCRSS
jgi:hypothetical protein